MLTIPVAVPEVAPAGDEVFDWLVDRPHAHGKRPLEIDDLELS